MLRRQESEIKPEAEPMSTKGLRDLSGVRLTRHAVERFVERFQPEPSDEAEEVLRRALTRTRRLGTNSETSAIAALGLHEGRALVAILQGDACLTVLTWAQFEPRLAEFGRQGLPRRWGRWLRRLAEPEVG